MSGLVNANRGFISKRKLKQNADKKMCGMSIRQRYRGIAAKPLLSVSTDGVNLAFVKNYRYLGYVVMNTGYDENTYRSCACKK